MNLTESYRDCFSPEVLARYQFAETRNAARILAVTNGAAFGQLQDVLHRFELRTDDLLKPGGQESDLAARLNRMFRDCGWREARVDTLIRLSLQLTPLPGIGEARRKPMITETVNKGYKVDNFRDRIALDVEWNAKDGNLDRDIGAYRALYDAALIDGACWLRARWICEISGAIWPRRQAFPRRKPSGSSTPQPQLTAKSCCRG